MTTRVVWAALAGVVAVACVTNPATGRRQLNIMSEAQEIALGKETDAQIRQEMGVYPDEAWQRYVSEIGMRMARQSHRPNLPWTFTVVDAQAVNAFALPGGYIYVTRGILPFLRDEAELANVLGHEIGHVTAQHGANAWSKQALTGVTLGIGRLFVEQQHQAWFSVAEGAFGLLYLKHGRDDELESDRLGVGYAAALGWDPSGMAGLLGTLGRISHASGSSRGVPNFLSTHPMPEDRVAKVGPNADAVRTSSSTTTNARAFADRLDGLVWGDSREQGFVRGRDFLHPILRIRVRFPEGWQVSNGASQVTATPSDDSTRAMLLEIVDAQGESPTRVARARMAKADVTEISGETLRLNGLSAFVGTFVGGSGNDRIALRGAWIESGGRLYQFLGLSTEATFARADVQFREAVSSFRAITQAEADALQPARIDFHTVRQGETWATLAKTRAEGLISAQTLAIMNGADPASTPAPGTRIRIVVGG